MDGASRERRDVKQYKADNSQPKKFQNPHHARHTMLIYLPVPEIPAPAPLTVPHPAPPFPIPISP